MNQVQETLFQGDIANTLLVSTALLIIVVAIEIVSRPLNLQKEISRKAAHILCGLGLVAIPWNLKSAWAPFAFALVFFCFMHFTKRLGLLKSVHGVVRKTSGASLYPLGVCSAFLVAGGNTPLFKYAILIMALSDAFAAIVGQNFGKRHYRVFGETRTLEGSLACGLTTYALVSSALVLHGSSMSPLSVVASAIVLSLILSGVEALSLKGSDNFFLPLSAALCLRFLAPHPFVCLGLGLCALPLALIVVKIGPTQRLRSTKS